MAGSPGSAGCRLCIGGGPVFLGLWASTAAPAPPRPLKGNTAQEAKNPKLVMGWYREVIAFGQVDLAPKYIMAGEVY